MNAQAIANDPPTAFRPTAARYWMLVAALGSLLLHAGLWFWLQGLYMPATSLHSKDPVRKFNLERVEINPKWMEPKTLTPPEHVSATPSPDRSSLTPTEEKRSFAQLLAEAPSAPTMPAGSPKISQDKPVPALGDLEKTPADGAMRSRLEEELRFAQEQQLSKTSKAAGAGRPILNVPGAPVAPKPGATSLAPPTQTTVGPSRGPKAGEGDLAFTGSSRLDDFFGPGGLPPPPPPLATKPKEPDVAKLSPQSLLRETLPTTQKFESLNPLLNVELFTFERPGRDGKREGYFLIRVSARPNQQLQVIPKDVDYIMDISSSIGSARLEAYVAAVLTAIPDLNPADRFKILAFRDKLMSFRDDWVSARDPPMAEVRAWLKELNSGGVTDFYQGLSPLTRQARERGRTVVALVMSDGMPTSGVLDSTQIISEFSASNGGKASIFTMSNGRTINNFLLDFLAYCNQGRLRYEREVGTSAKSFGQLIQQVRNPLFLDLRFRFAGVDGDQVYPQNLPHLYQESPLLLFGRYTPGQTAPISLQILGESVDATRELLVQLPLAKAAAGPDSLPYTWARQRIYHLLGQMTRSRARQDAILNEVRQISAEYGVEVPYF